MPQPPLFDPTLSGPRLALVLLKELGREVQADVRGTSMHPLMTEGDRVSLQLLEPEKLKTGDLLAFWAGKNIVVHRLIRKKKWRGRWWFCQKGDNGSQWSWIAADNILGKAQAVCRSRRTLYLARWPWTWVNPCLGLATASLIRVEKTVPTSGLASPGRRFLSILINVGYKVLRLLMLGLCLIASHRHPQLN